MSFPNENGGGGFGFDFSEGGTTMENSTDTDPSSDSGDGGRDSSEVARDVVIIVVVIIAGVLALLLVVYLLSLVADRYLCCCPFFQPVGDDSYQWDHGPIAHKARLTGLTLRERRSILAHLLVGKPYSNDMKEEANGVEEGEKIALKKSEIAETPEGVVDQEMTQEELNIEDDASQITNDSALKEEETNTEELDLEKGVTDTPRSDEEETEAAESQDTKDPQEVEPDVEEAMPTTETIDDANHLTTRSDVDEIEAPEPDTEEALATTEALDDADHLTTCAICLSDYADGELVLQAKECRHMFHHNCAMEWLDKHDHCPYCRKEIVSPAEFREAAVEILGQARVAQLSKLSDSRSRDNSTESQDDSAQESDNTSQSELEAQPIPASASS